LLQFLLFNAIFPLEASGWRCCREAVVWHAGEMKAGLLSERSFGVQPGRDYIEPIADGEQTCVSGSFTRWVLR
jgi:hypothetical protein